MRGPKNQEHVKLASVMRLADWTATSRGYSVKSFVGVDVVPSNTAETSAPIRTLIDGLNACGQDVRSEPVAESQLGTSVPPDVVVVVVGNRSRKIIDAGR